MRWVCSRVGCAVWHPGAGGRRPYACVRGHGQVTGLGHGRRGVEAIASGFPLQSAGYAPQVREAVVRRRADGHRFILLYAVRDERVHLLTLA